ncbi:rho guanine nucleotide exchange factor 19 [Callorhinchus milii]|uniref:rho guanine nucleotide exchange factor 19 n=1 Tax=Callorhinchus milii TaxID=7868 RepID=UPI001C3F91E4|nr:rho guanine nucleotide exchange factor 19 [Callorhinchus milii]XP_007905414.2 rho guanine nucleotide exchange factor 19 [Callorhinchus milii]XP_007905415.2 rho guanine nucleotide exchange factor 19 [Callorhinchus milii]
MEMGKNSQQMESLRSRESKYIDTQPLYQNYWLQKLGGDQGKLRKDCSVLDTTLSLAGLVSSSILNSSSSQLSPKDSSFTFWREIPEVKASGVLASITAQECTLQEAMFEVITSEASYLRSLTVAVNHFSKCRELLDTLTPTEVHTLFSNLLGVREASERFLLELEDRLEEKVLVTNIGDIVLKHCAAFRKVYVPYVTNQMYQESMMQQLVGNEKFTQVLRELEANSMCQRQPLKSFLILPFQRITRLKILLENILTLSSPKSSMSECARSAVGAIGEIVSECDKNVKKMKQIEDLVYLEKRLEFPKTKSLPLISQTRWLVKEGELKEIFVQEPGATTTSLHLHLFNDLLLLSRKRAEGTFSVVDYAKPSKVKAICFQTKSLVFVLQLSENHEGNIKRMILGADNQCELQDWVTAISTPGVTPTC